MSSSDPTSDFPFSIGVSTADITPPAGATLAGYKPRVSTGVGHTLRAEAVYCADKDGAWILIACDFLGIPLSLTNGIRSDIASRTGLKPGAVMIAGTHTHSGPSLILVDEAEQNALDLAYLETFRSSLLRAAVSAVRSAAPGRFEAVETQAGGLSSNRRVRLPDGSWGNEWEDPEGRHPGFNDPTMLVGAVVRPDGNREALFVNFGCHPVTLGPSSTETSPDYPGYLKDELERSGKTRTAVFLLAGAGNVNPRVCIRTGERYPKALGGTLAGMAAGTLGTLRPVPGTRVKSALVPWHVVRTRDAFKFSGLAASRTGDTVETELQALAAGETAFLGIPGELFSEYNRIIRASSPFRHTFIITLANDYTGYFPTDRAQEEGAYETKMAPASGLESSLVDAAKRALDAVSEARHE